MPTPAKKKETDAVRESTRLRFGSIAEIHQAEMVTSILKKHGGPEGLAKAKAELRKKAAEVQMLRQQLVLKGKRAKADNAAL